jgi:hypothetical protein
MKTRVLVTSAALAAAVMWTAPAASATTPYCDSLPPRDAHECNCGFDFAPGTPDFHACIYGNAVAPSPNPNPSP